MVFLDVGANNGEDGILLAKSCPVARLYSFEPCFQLHDAIRKNVEVAGLQDRFELVPKAMSNVSGTVEFYTASRLCGDEFDCAPREFGCSSLFPLVEDLDARRPEHQYRAGDVLTVPVITAKEFLREKGIDRVDWMHCDAQGHDLQCLWGFGEDIHKLMGGVIEMAADDSGKMYVGQRYTCKDALEFLEEQGFQIIPPVPNSNKSREVNIFFVRHGCKVWEQDVAFHPVAIAGKNNCDASLIHAPYCDT